VLFVPYSLLNRWPTHSALLFAANDTSSSVLSRILWLLASQPEAQARLRKEVSEARAEAGGDLGYDELMELPYLDAVVRESLRLCVRYSSIHP
jgi:cytochrome P450